MARFCCLHAVRLVAAIAVAVTVDQVHANPPHIVTIFADDMGWYVAPSLCIHAHTCFRLFDYPPRLLVGLAKRLRIERTRAYRLYSY